MDSVPKGGPSSNFDDDRSGMLVASMIALVILSTSAVFFRLLSRKLARAGYWWDDILVVVALLLALIGPSLNIYAVKHHGFGKHIAQLGKDAKQDAKETLKMLWIYQICFALATGTIKLCILAFYRRIFPIRQLRIILYVLSATVLIFTTAVVLISIFQCSPINRYWNPKEPGHCSIDMKTNLYITGAINTSLDFIIVMLPVPLLWQLRTSKGQKCLLTGIFTAAGFVCIVSILRLIACPRNPGTDPTFEAADVALWSAVEPCAGVISACMPSLRPFFTIVLRSCHVKLPVLHRSRTRARPNSGSSTLPWLTYHRNVNGLGGEMQSSHVEAKVENSLQTVESASKMSRDRASKQPAVNVVEEAEVPYGEIRVQTEIRWSVAQRFDYDYRVY